MYETLLTGDDEQDQLTFNVFKMTAAISVYLSATNNNKLHKGLPGTHASSVLSSSDLERPRRPFFLEVTNAISKLKNSPDGHYRGFHFRNLRHEKFYQGEHEDKKTGSRWTFVSDSVVNMKVTPETLELDKSEMSM